MPGREAIVGRTVCSLKATPKLLGVGIDTFQLVSRRHALVRIGTTGTTICRDDKAVNGLWVDDRKIGKGQSTALIHGCKVAFGHQLIEYKVHLSWACDFRSTETFLLNFSKWLPPAGRVGKTGIPPRELARFLLHISANRQKSCFVADP
eukprot:SAG25_NODE_11_length_28117_cov_24.264901_8_plen_149_part_00